MSFRQRQKYRGGRYIAVLESEQKILENGCVVYQSVNQSDKVLPDAKLFDLENQLKAGVNLEEVNSKVLSPKSIDASKVVASFKPETVKPNNETVKPNNKDTSNEG